MKYALSFLLFSIAWAHSVSTTDAQCLLDYQGHSFSICGNKLSRFNIDPSSPDMSDTAVNSGGVMNAVIDTTKRRIKKSLIGQQGVIAWVDGDTVRFRMDTGAKSVGMPRAEATSSIATFATNDSTLFAIKLSISSFNAFYLTLGSNAFNSNSYYLASNPNSFTTLAAVASAGYITSATAASTYQPIGSYYLSSNPSGYITSSALSPYATTASLSSYATTVSLGSYLTTASAASTYQTKLTAGTGINIAGGTISATGGSGTVTSVTAGTGLSGGTITTSGTISLPNTGTAGTYGSGTAIPVITTDAQGRVSSITTSAPKLAKPYQGTTDASGNYSVTFGTAYSTTPNIQVSILNQSNYYQYVRVTTASTTGFTVNVYSLSAVTSLPVVGTLTNALLGATVSPVSGATVQVLVTEF